MKIGDEPSLALSGSGRLRKAVKYALLTGVAGMGWTTVAGAQEAPAAGAQEAEQLDAIEVTGSRIRRVELETSTPVFVVDRESIEKSGVPTLGELLQEMPSIAGAATNPQVNNGGGTGAATVSLRGLSSVRTLLLLNGRRLVTADVNAIPINLVERVEVLKGGASSVYGSDAVAGVVNIITRKGFQGAEYAVGYGISSRDDNETANTYLTMGLPGEKGGLMFGLNYDNIRQVSSADRDFSKDPFALYYGQQIVLGSSRAFPHRIRVPTPATAGITLDCDGDGNITEAVVVRRIDGTDGRQPSDYRCFIGGGPGNDTYDFQDVNVTVTPQERFGSWLQGDYQVAQDVKFFTEVFYHNTQANFQIAPEPYDNRAAFANTPIDAANVFNPFGQTLTDVRVRLVDVGNRTEAFDTDRFQINAGFNGNGVAGMLENWKWEGYISQGRIKLSTAANGELYTPAMLAALGPSFDNADNDPTADADGDGDPIDQPTCGTANTAATGAPPPAPTLVPNCTPVDFFGTISADSVAAIAPEVHDREEDTMRVLAFNVSTSDLLALPAGGLGAAFGFERRDESADFQPDYLRDAGFISGNSSDPVKGSISVSELYGEVVVPVLADMPAAHSLIVNAGLRHSDYETFGETTNGSLGIEYRPIEDLLLRASYAEVFRAPTIGDLFSGQFESADTYSDPCNNVPVAQTTGPEFLRACQNVSTADVEDPQDVDADGITNEPDGNIDFAQTDSQLPATVGGNPNLQPEDGDATTFGFVYSPRFYNPLTVEVDYFQYELADTIGTVGSDTRLDQCFTNGLFCGSFTRDAVGEVDSLIDVTDNVGRLSAKGVDIGFKLNYPSTAFGNIRASVDTTYLIEWENEQLQGDPTSIVQNVGKFRESSAGGDGHFARVRGSHYLDWSLGPWGARWSSRYVHGVEEDNPDLGVDVTEGCPASGVQASGAVCRREIDAVWTHDLVGSYAFAPFNMELSLGIDNVTDELAPLIYTGFNGTTDVRTYDTVGRYYWARVKFNL